MTLVEDMPVTRAVGAELRRMRDSHGWTRQEFVERLGATWKVNTYKFYESGIRPLPLARLVEISRALEDEPGNVLLRALGDDNPARVRVCTETDAATFLRDMNRAGYSLWRNTFERQTVADQPDLVVPVQVTVPFAPDWVCCPGETLAEWFTYTHFPRTVATKHGIEDGTLTRLLNGDEPLTEDLARKLLNLTFIPAPFWLALEHNYRAGLAAGLTHNHPT